MATVKLGPLELSSDLLLAPMMDVTTPSYVKMIEHYGGMGLYSMPMVFINQISQAPKTIRPILEFAENNTPSSVQICSSGKSYETIKDALEILNSYNFSIIDLNSGCPARHTCNSGGGASLMKPHRYNDLQHFVQSTIKLSNKPVSVKIRTGWGSNKNMEQIIRMIEDEGAAFLIVHGRLAKQGYSGVVDIDSIQRAKEICSIPVVGNGDVFNYRTYDLMKKITNVDAIMIGRAVMGFPEMFSNIIKESEPIATLIDSSELKSQFYNELNAERTVNSPEKIQDYLKLLLESIEPLGKYYNNDRFKLSELRRNAIWMMKGAYNCAKIREKVGRTKKIDELIEYIFSTQFVSDLTKTSTALSE